MSLNHKIKEDINVTNANVTGQSYISGNTEVGAGTFVYSTVTSDQQFIGYSNTDTFGSVNTVTALNTVAGKTAAAGTALRLPTGAYITRVVVITTIAITSAGNPTLDIGTGVNATTTSAGFFDNIDHDNVTIGTGLGPIGHFLVNTQPVTGTSFVAEPAEAAATGGGEKRVGGTSVNYVTCNNKTAALTTGAIKVIINVYNPSVLL